MGLKKGEDNIRAYENIGVTIIIVLFAFYFDRIESAQYEQLSVAKSTKNLKKVDKNLLAKLHEKEIEIAKIKNELAKVEIEKVNIQSKDQEQKLKLESLQRLSIEEGEKVEELELSIKRRADTIKNYTLQVERLNRQYEKMLDSAEDGEVLGPLEAMIKSYQKDIEINEKQILIVKKKWLDSQEELVQTMSDVSELKDSNSELSARATVLGKKRCRLLQEINTSQTELKAMNNNVKNMLSDKIRIDKLLGEYKTAKSQLSDENSIFSKETANELRSLKENIRSIESEMIEAKESKRLVLSQLVCVEAEILEWKKKIQLEKETRLTLESGADALEIKGMQREINRMRHRLESINREQETMIRAM